MHALKSAPLRKQHESLRKHIAALKRHLNPLLLASNAAEVRTLLTQLLGEFGKHLQQEAKELYPPLDGTEDTGTKATAARFGAEMKQNLPRLAEFNRRWPSADTIRADGSLFIKEAGDIFQWLERRLIAENTELYPLLDRLDGATSAVLNNPDLKIARI
ncbi:MAG: hemerythrin domain-containing protein [Burkholderiaceae bacterium]